MIFFCVLTYTIIYVMIHHIIFRFYPLKYSSFFFSSTLVLTFSYRRSLYTFYYLQDHALCANHTQRLSSPALPTALTPGSVVSNISFLGTPSPHRPRVSFTSPVIHTSWGRLRSPSLSLSTKNPGLFIYRCFTRGREHRQTGTRISISQKN